MYNEKLEQLIDAALADGELTEKEKQILFKKAQEMGVDLDEFEMVLDARLVKFKKAEEEKAKTSAPKSNKLGDVKKCPACGAIVQSYQGVCAECGYAFENIEANAAVKELTNLLRKANFDSERDEIIDTFPIPMDKGALIEFITWLAPQSLDSDNSLANSYQKKYDEAINKAKVSFADDKDIAPLIAQYEKDKKKIVIKNAIRIVRNVLAPTCVVGLILYWIFAPNLDGNLEDCSSAIVKSVKKGKLDRAVELYAEYDDEDDKDELADEAALIATAALEKGEVAIAEQILKLTGARLGLPDWEDHNGALHGMTTKLYDYYIKTKEYDKARNLIETAKDDYERWGNHIKDVVVSLCKDGKKAEAQRYLNQYAPNIHDQYDNLGLAGYKLPDGGTALLGDNAYVTKLIQDIINTY